MGVITSTTPPRPRAGRLGVTGVSPGAALWLILVGGLGFAAFALLTIYAPELRASRAAGNHALSRAALGYAGLVTLLRQGGSSVTIRRDLAVAGGPPLGLLVLTPPAGTDRAALDALLDPVLQRGGMPVLLVLPKWTARRDPERPDWQRDPALVPLGSAARLLPDGKLSRIEGSAVPPLQGIPPLPAKRRLQPAPLDSLQSVVGADWQPLLTDPAGRAVLARSRTRPQLHVLADPDLLNNRGLRLLEGAETAVTLVTALQLKGAIGFDVTLNGLGHDRNPLRLALEPPLLAATLCLLAAGLLTAWHAAHRFGPARAEAAALALGPVALADNTAALLAMAGREHRMGARYAALTARLAARLTGASPAALERRRLALGLEAGIEALSAAAAAATNRATLLRAARNLHRWRQELTRERR